MIGASTAMALAMALAAHGPRVFLSVDRPFLPDQPGSVLRVEMEGSHTLDLRLYQLKDPERFLTPTRGEEGSALEERVSPDAPRAASPTSVLAGRAASLRKELRSSLLEVLTPEAVGAVRLLAPGALVEPARELPFLQGEQLLRRWDLPCGGAEAHSYCEVDLGALPAGAYLAEGVSGREAAYAVVLVSNLALASRQLPGQLLIYAVDARTGDPRPGVQVTVNAGGVAVAHGPSGPQGTFTAKLAQRRLTVFGRQNADLAVLDLDFFDSRTHGPRVWVTTDRGEARPGELLHLAGIQRPGPAQPRDLAVTLEDGRGTPIAHGLVHEDIVGLFTGELAVPAVLAPGIGHVVVQADGRDSIGEVWLHNPPEADLLASVRLTADGGTAEVDVRDRLGHPVGGTVEWRWIRTPLSAAPGSLEPPPRLSSEEVASGTEAVGDDGRLQFHLPSGAPDARFTVEVAAIDAWGHRAIAEDGRVLLRGPVHVNISTDRRVYAPGDSAKVTLTTTDAEGHPAAARLNLRFTASRLGTAAETSTSAVLTQDLPVPASGQAEVAVPHLTPGYYELAAVAGPQRLASSVVFVTDKGGDIPFTPDELTFIPDKASYAPGETARVLIFAPFESASALVTVESGEILRQESVIIQRSSALVVVKIPPTPLPAGLTLSATAFTAGESFQRSRTLRIGPPEPLALSAALSPDAHGTGLELHVSATDRQGKPVAGVAAVALWRDRAAEASLAPSPVAFLDPRPAPEGRGAVSLEYRSNGYSGGSPAERLEQARSELGPAEGFTPQKGVSRTLSRPSHATAAGEVRLPPSDRAGLSHISIDPGDAAEIAVEVIAVAPAGPDGVAPVASASAVAASPNASIAPTVPAVVRSGDKARALLRVTAPASVVAPASILINGAPLQLQPGRSITDSIPVEGSDPRIDVRLGTRPLFDQRLPTSSGSEWKRVSSGLAHAGPATRLAADAEETQRVRLISGPIGLLHLQAESLHSPARAGPWEQVHLAGEPQEDRTAQACGRLSALMALEKIGEESRDLGPAVAGLLALAAPDGSLGAYPGSPFDRQLTAMALWLLVQAEQLGTEVPLEWKDRIRSRLDLDVTRPEGRIPETALALLGVGEGWSAWMEGLVAREDRLGPTQQSFLALALWQASDRRAKQVAARIERRAGVQSGRACWSDEECHPGEPPTRESLTSTASAVLVLSQLASGSPRIADGMRYLMEGNDPESWISGASAGLLPLALAAGRRSLPDRAGRVELADGEGHRSRAEVPVGGSAILYTTGPSQLRIQGQPLFYEISRTRTEPSDSAGDLDVERRWYLADSQKAERGAPLAGKVPVGSLVWVEISVAKAQPGSAVSIDDRFPAGLVPVEQPALRGPVESLLSAGGSASFTADRVRLQTMAGNGPVRVGYLARATLPGTYVAPPCLAETAQGWGRSNQERLVIRESP